MCKWTLEDGRTIKMVNWTTLVITEEYKGRKFEATLDSFKNETETLEHLHNWFKIADPWGDVIKADRKMNPADYYDE